MTELGKYLKEQREVQNLTIDQIQEKTKIRRRYIEAIEKGDYGILPGSFYARAFIKNYAETLGLDAHKVMKQFEHDLPSVPSPPVEAAPVSRSRSKKIRQSTASASPSSPKIARWTLRIVFYAFILLVAFVIWNAVNEFWTAPEDDPAEPGNPGIITEGDLPENEDEAPDEQENEEPAPGGDRGEPGEPEEPEVPEPELVRIETTGNRTTYEWRSAPGFDEVRIEAVSTVWFRIYEPDSGAVIDEAQLSAGQERTWDLSEYERFTIHVGNIRGPNISINDMLMDIEDLGDAHHITVEHIEG